MAQPLRRRIFGYLCPDALDGRLVGLSDYLISVNVFVIGNVDTGKCGKYCESIMSQVRVSPYTHQLLKSLATSEGKPMQEILDQAVEAYRRRAFLEGLSEDYRLLQSDNTRWKDHEEDMALWDNVLVDALDDE